MEQQGLHLWLRACSRHPCQPGQDGWQIWAYLASTTQVLWGSWLNSSVPTCPLHRLLSRKIVVCLCLPSPVVQMCQAQGIEWSSLAELGLTKALAEFMVAMAILKHSETNLKSSAQLCCQRPLCKCLQPTTAPRCLSLVPFLAPWYRSSGPKVLPACICTQRERSI